MLPIFRQRLLIAAAVLVGGLCWLAASGPLRADDGSTGLSLVAGRSGWPIALAAVLLAGLPAMIGAALSSALGHPLTGLFVASAALMVPAASGGPINGFLWRAELPGAYAGLAFETLLWLVVLVGLMALISRCRVPVRQFLSGLATDEHYGDQTRLRGPGPRALLAGLITAAAGALLCNILLQSSDTGQVVGALVIGFAVAALVTQLILPQRNPTAMVAAPLIVAAGAYLYVLVSYTHGDEVLRAWHVGELPGLALALPIHYASAGVAGACMGIGIGQAVDRARDAAVHAV